MGAGNWPLILKLGHNIWVWSGRTFDICPSFCVTWLWTWQKRQLWRVDRQSHTGLIYKTQSFRSQSPGLKMQTYEMWHNWWMVSLVYHVYLRAVIEWCAGRFVFQCYLQYFTIWMIYHCGKLPRSAWGGRIFWMLNCMKISGNNLLIVAGLCFNRSTVLLAGKLFTVKCMDIFTAWCITCKRSISCPNPFCRSAVRLSLM